MPHLYRVSCTMAGGRGSGRAKKENERRRRRDEIDQVMSHLGNQQHRSVFNTIKLYSHK